MPTSATTQLRNTLRYIRTNKIVKGVSSVILMAVFIIKASLDPSTGSIIAAVFVSVAMILSLIITYGLSESNQGDSDQESPED
jgi:hypothetical protein